MANKEIVLDEEAEKLFQDLGGMETQKTTRGYSVPGLAEALHEEEKLVDAWRLLLVDLLHELAQIIMASSKGSMAGVDPGIRKVQGICSKLVKMPAHDGRILVRYLGRGVPGEGRASRRYDYVILYGSIALDLNGVQAASRRLGVTASKMPATITQAFESLAKCQIINMNIALGDWKEEDKTKLYQGLGFLSEYLRLTRGRGGQGGLKNFYLVKDEKRQPDACLSLLAAANNLEEKSANGLARKIHVLMLKAKPGSPLEHFPNIYEAIFGFKKLQNQIQKPAVEINNLKWLLSSNESDVLSTHLAKLVRITAYRFGKTTQKTARILDGLYGHDFGKIDPIDLAERLALVSELVSAIKKMDNLARETVTQLLDHLKGRLDLVPDDIYKALTVHDGEVEAVLNGETVHLSLDKQVMSVLTFFKQRAATKGKMKSLIRRSAAFDETDYDVIAADFDISVANSKELVGLLASCFEKNGRFKRRSFEACIPAFQQHERKVFEFLWHYLKQIMDRNDRISFLNALQLLIDQMKQKQRALSVLLQDFSSDPEVVTFHDRNALMLSTLLLRKYNKELHTDIEITPEEVLLVIDGLDPDVVALTSQMIDDVRDAYFMKVRTVHRCLKDALDPYNADKVMPARYVFTLEREIYILLALLGGATSRVVIRSAAREYGNPEAEIYWMERSQNEMTQLLQILQVVIRALGRVGDKSDLIFLREMAESAPDFAKLKNDARHKDHIRRVMRWVDKAIKDISSDTFEG